MDIEALIAEFPPHARPAIRAVVQQRTMDALIEFKSTGVPPGISSASGITPLFIAATAGDARMVRALLGVGANPNGHAARAPIYAAMDLRAPEVARILLAAGANPNGRSGDRPAILEAAMLGNDAALDALVRAGADTRLANDAGVTAAIEGAAAQQWRSVERILAAGADPWAASRAGVTVGLLAYRSRLATTTLDGQARMRVVASLQRAGFPWPPPEAPEVRARIQAGTWHLSPQ